MWNLLLSVFVCLYDFLFIISSEQLDYDVPSRILFDGSCAWHSLRFLIHVLMYFVNSECFQQVYLRIFFSSLHCLLSSGDSNDMEWMWDHLRPSHNSYMLCSFFKMFFFSVFITTFKFTIFCRLPQIPPITVFNPISHFITFIFWSLSWVFYISSMSLLNFLVIQNTNARTTCDFYLLVFISVSVLSLFWLTNRFPHYRLYFLASLHAW